uniref:VQ domain-containing protein n=2 Tax=Oryza TaxID=4527 RepID=A0A0E0G227_ORYNI
MGDAGGGMAAHWAALYGGGVNGGAAAGAEGTVSSPTSGGSPVAGGSPTRGGAAALPGIEGGRVAKPARRRSRASRRAPVTLLNTDTSNFRAMVQQFTGIPTPPYATAAAAGPVISFGAGEYGGGAMPVRPSPTPASVMSFDHLGHHHRQAASSLQSQLFRPQHQHHHQYGGGGGDVGYGGGGGDMFLHGFESSSAEERLLLQSIQAAQMLPAARPTTTSANNANGYNFG